MTRWKGVAMVSGAVLVHLSLGTIYTFGNMAPYLASYYRNYLHYDIQQSDLTWVYSAMIGSMGLCMSLGGLLDTRIGTRLTAILGCTLMCTGIFITYFTINYHYIYLVVTYGIMYGAGISLPYISLLSCGMRWFPDKRGLISGIIVAGFGLGTLFFNLVQTSYLNHENMLPNSDGFFYEESLLHRVPNIFLLLGGVYCGMQVIGCILANPPPPVLELDKTPETNPVLAKITMRGVEKNGSLDSKDVELSLTQEDNQQPKQYTTGEFIRTREFYLMWLTFFFNAHTANFVSSTYKMFGLTFIKDDLFLAIVGSVGAIFNAAGRIGWGLMVDRYTYKVCLRIMLSLSLVFLLSMPATQLLGKYAFAFWMFCIHLLISSSFVLFPAYTAKYFGSKYSGTNYGLVFSQMFVGGPTSGLLVSNLVGPIGYTGMFFVMAGFTVISLLLTIPFRQELYIPKKPIAVNVRK